MKIKRNLIYYILMLNVLLSSEPLLLSCRAGSINSIEEEKPDVEKPEKESTLKINAATYNLRMQTSADQEEKAWENRRAWAIKIIKKHNFDIIGTQECFKNQLEDVLQAGNYSYIGVGRDDGQSKGEHSAIIYQNQKFEVLDKGDFWLSETPEVPSSGWDATIKRVCSWGKFREKETGKVFFFFNAHYDHKGKIARKESSKLVLKKIEEIAGDTPAFFSGDLNALPDEESIVLLSESKMLWDARNVSSTPVYGTEGTYHGYNLDGKTTHRIDYIFVSAEIDVLEYGVLNDDITEGEFSSDHFPVLIKAEL
ncbi:Metal-dependent hydrolase, endonuclease/exonuclease/phosphatase family [Mariniphaga anaerophila]|uniref:Metal-dependent hydrolase, endonuclease/exonuclease/phosphatase family n=1 Tax=Mariniphaga anaerophila TaxID=1484053 RepID=A0A1M4W9N1_9BACT|nr:endonuclease/exonuclease/phosphatase family protein [Mariniphaga anaerophila]SHE77919.1 Metal-dependent hydrolase, endonuclease/exonuclease/phosphatase family [Mariniphaga anaerophila]